ncbi:MAG TPA: AMP-binding protein [Bryobacteraceae bacterium]|nr:AMP-binding protein [Bryobacteraceae bacterium]
MPNVLKIDYGSAHTAAVDCERDAAYSYKQLGEGVRRISGILESDSKALVCCFCKNDYETLCGYLACLESGHAVMLLDPELARQRPLVETYRPDYILHSSTISMNSYNGYEIVDAAAPVIWRRLNREHTHICAELALLLTTSGSTGTAKFVRLSESNLYSNAYSICRGLDIHDSDCAITSLPFHYSYGLSVVHSHLMAGACLALTSESLTSRFFWKACREYKCTSFGGVPYTYHLLHRLGLPNDEISSIHTMTQAGGHLPAHLVEHNYRLMTSRRGRFFVMYGQTEATARICILPAECLPAKLGSAGKPVTGGDLSIVDGTVVYRGPNVMLGYAQTRDDLSRGDDLRGVLRTGDQGYLDHNGFLYITGRANRFAKISGLRINLDEVETILKPHGPAAVISLGEKILVFCETGQNGALIEFRDALARELSLHRQFFDVRSIASLPLKSNGKIDYRVLEEAARC